MQFTELEMRFSVLARLVCALLTLMAVVGFTANAKQLTITDASGEPLQHAVVELPQPVQTPDSVAIMDQVHKQFVPYVLTIQKGQQVNFPNSDDIRHHVYSFSPTKPFELKLYAGTPNAPLQFNNAGVVVLGCNIHDSMVGYIYVSNGNQVLISNAKGVVQIPHNVDSVTVWHPEQQDEIASRKSVTLPSGVDSHTVMMNTEPPAPRNTFGERFGNNE